VLKVNRNEIKSWGWEFWDSFQNLWGVDSFFKTVFSSFLFSEIFTSPKSRHIYTKISIFCCRAVFHGPLSSLNHRHFLFLFFVEWNTRWILDTYITPRALLRRASKTAGLSVKRLKRLIVVKLYRITFVCCDLFLVFLFSFFLYVAAMVVMKRSDGKWFSLNNRRLYVYKRLRGLGVECVMSIPVVVGFYKQIWQTKHLKLMYRVCMFRSLHGTPGWFQREPTGKASESEVWSKKVCIYISLTLFILGDLDCRMCRELFPSSQSRDQHERDVHAIYGNQSVFDAFDFVG